MLLFQGHFTADRTLQTADSDFTEASGQQQQQDQISEEANVHL